MNCCHVAHTRARVMATFALRGRVAVLRVVRPPVNSLGLAARQGLADGLDQAKKAGAKAVVIAGDGATFPAGADIQEFAKGGHLKSPMLGEVIERVSALGMHSIAAVHGTALGGGMELTLACHYRLMLANSKFGLPEVHLGLLPGAGGTQRLPRLIGYEQAIKMLTSGAMVNAKAALLSGLCDEVVPAPADSSASPADVVIDRAVAFAEEQLCDAPIDPHRVLASRPLPDPGAEFFANARKAAVRAAKGEVAPLRIIDAVAAAVEAPSFAAGLEAEGALFMELALGDQSKALQQVCPDCARATRLALCL